MIDSVQMRELMSEALVYDQTDTYDDDMSEKPIFNDLLSQTLLLNRIRKQDGDLSMKICPLCKSEQSKSAECKCSRHIAYSYKIKKEETIKLINETR